MTQLYNISTFGFLNVNAISEGEPNKWRGKKTIRKNGKTELTVTFAPFFNLNTGFSKKFCWQPHENKRETADQLK